MNIIKKIIIFLLTSFTIIVAVFYQYIKTLPTAPPDFINSSELNNAPATPFSCTNKTKFNYAYQVHVEIESIINDKQVYLSSIQFRTQLSQANDAIIRGQASQISIDEDQGSVDIEDVYYISRVNPQPFALFTAFNNLGLPEKHPMKIIGQLLKALSIGEEGKKYHFSYDSMQRTYSYQHSNKAVNRNASITTANLSKLTSSLQMPTTNNSWEVILDNDCMPLSLASEERQGISAAGHSGYIRFSIHAKKITPYTDLSNLKLTNFTNVNNLWQVKSIASDNFEKSVETEEELWAIIAGFSSNKNSAQLIKAADYLIDNISVESLNDVLIKDNMGDSEKRNIAFALSLSGHPDAENYLIQSLEQLTENGIKGDISHDLQKVRLMVSLSGNGQVSEYGFQALSKLATDINESNNVRNNALINLGSSLQQMENQGQAPSGLSEQLTRTLAKAMTEDQASSAILAAGNAKLSGLDDAIILKLASNNSKERYAAGMVLARNPEHTDTLLSHLANEPSDLVNFAILTNLDKGKLSPQQIDTLKDIANKSSKDLAHAINPLIL